MRAALLIAQVDLRRRVRDRSLIIFGIVAPIVLATIIGLAFGDGGDFEVRIGLVDDDGSEVSSSIAAALTTLEGDSPMRFQPVDSPAAARDGVVTDDLGAALIIPAGFGTSLAGEDPLGITVVRGSDDLFSGDIAIGVAQGVAAQIDASRLAAATAIAAGADPATAVERAMALQPALPVEESVLGGEVNVTAYMAPAMAMLFLFFTVGAGARSLLTEEREGTLTRLRSSPVTNAQILGGKLIAVLATGLLSLLVVYGVSTLVLGASWGEPAGVLLVIVAAVLAVAGIGTFVTALARTDAQAEGYTTMLTFGLALVGGNFTPPGDMTELMRRLSLLTPNGWALRAFTELSAGRGGAGDVVVHVVVLLGVAGSTGAVGIGLLARRVSR